MPSWTSLLEPFFASAVRQRGRQYIRAVRNVRAADGILSAIVDGTDVYDVELAIHTRDASRATIAAFCTCPYEFNCKHVWALTLGHGDKLAALWGDPPARVSVVREGDSDRDPDPYDDDDDWGEDDHGGDDESSPAAGRRQAANAPRPADTRAPASSGTKVLRFGDLELRFTEAAAALLDGRIATARDLMGQPLAGGIFNPKLTQTPQRATNEPEWKNALRRADVYSWRRGSLTPTPLPPIVDDLWYVIDADLSRSSRQLCLTLMFRSQRGKELPTAERELLARARAGTAPPAVTNAASVPSDLAPPPPGRLAASGLKRFALRESDIERIQSAADRAICAMLAGGGVDAHDYRSTFNPRGSTEWKIQPHLARTLLSLMYATGRLAWRDDRDKTAVALKWDADRPWRLALHVRQSITASAAPQPARRRATSNPNANPNANAEPEHVLVPRLERDGESLSITDPQLLLPGTPGFLMHNHTLAPLEASTGDLDWCNEVLIHRAPRVRRGEVADLLRGLASAKIPLEVELPAEWQYRTERRVPPTPRLTLSASLPGTSLPPPSSLYAVVDFLYDGNPVQDPHSPHITTTTADGQTVLISRHRNAESQFIARAIELGVKTDRYSQRSTLHTKQLNTLVPTLSLEGWEIRGEKGLYRATGAVSIRASSGIDWFDIEGNISFGEISAPIAQVLDALKRGDAFVSLGDGSLGMLPQQWLAANARWLSMGQAAGDSIRFSKAQVSVVDALLAQMPEASCDEQVHAARTRLRSFEGVTPRTEPTGFHGALRPYQREGLGWLHFLNEFGFGGCLADDMGLGKTVQVLAHILEQRALAQPAPGRNARAPKSSPGKKTKKAATGAGNAEGAATSRAPWLVVAPKSLIFNWAREAARFTPSLKVITHTGKERGEDAAAIAGADLVLTTYATMRLDLELLRRIHFDAVVLDEAQNIKNPASQAAKAARLLKSRRRLALTGTPVENRLDDLWSIFEFLNPGMLGTIRVFQAAMRTTPTLKSAANARHDPAPPQHAPAVHRPHPDATGDAAAAAILRRALRPFMLRRTKAAVAADLPARSEQILAVELEGKQRAMYDTLRKHYQALLLGKIDRDGIGRSKIQVLEALLRLRQAACHPALIEPKHDHADSAKITTLVDMLQQLTAEGHKVLVFSQFTALLAILRGRLDAHAIRHEYLDGSTSERDRAAAVDRFQTRDDARVFAISLKAGGVGLNLTAAEYVFLLDPWWNPAVEAQAIDRTHRIGQTKNVLAYRLIARGTVEERILELQSSKRELAEALMSDAQGPLASMTKDDLVWLLS